MYLCDDVSILLYSVAETLILQSRLLISHFRELMLIVYSVVLSFYIGQQRSVPVQCSFESFKPSAFAVSAHNFRTKCCSLSEEPGCKYCGECFRKNPMYRLLRIGYIQTQIQQSAFVLYVPSLPVLEIMLCLVITESKMATLRAQSIKQRHSGSTRWVHLA